MGGKKDMVRNEWSPDGMASMPSGAGVVGQARDWLREYSENVVVTSAGDLTELSEASASDKAELTALKKKIKDMSIRIELLDRLEEVQARYIQYHEDVKQGRRVPQFDVVFASEVVRGGWGRKNGRYSTKSCFLDDVVRNTESPCKQGFLKKGFTLHEKLCQMGGVVREIAGRAIGSEFARLELPGACFMMEGNRNADYSDYYRYRLYEEEEGEYEYRYWFQASAYQS